MEWASWVNVCLLERVFTLTPSLSLKWRGSKKSLRSGSPISLPLVLELFLQETFLSVVSSRMMMAVQTVKTVV